MITDAEVHVLLSEAIENRNFLPKNEPVFKSICQHPDFSLIKDRLSLNYLLNSMKRSGIDQAVLMGLPYLNAGLNQQSNAMVEAYVKKQPQKFKGLYIPFLGKIKKEAQNIRDLDPQVFLGIKLVCSWQGIMMDDPALTPLWEACIDKNFVAMLHTDHLHQSLDKDAPYRLLRLASANPKLKILAAHMGGLLCLYGLLPNVSQQLKNIRFVTSVSATMEMVKFAASVNPGNIIFGTDFPFNHCHDQITCLKNLNKLDLPPETLAQITGQNLKDFLEKKDNS